MQRRRCSFLPPSLRPALVSTSRGTLSARARTYRLYRLRQAERVRTAAAEVVPPEVAPPSTVHATSSASAMPTGLPTSRCLPVRAFLTNLPACLRTGLPTCLPPPHMPCHASPRACLIACVCLRLLVSRAAWQIDGLAAAVARANLGADVLAKAAAWFASAGARSITQLEKNDIDGLPSLRT